MDDDSEPAWEVERLENIALYDVEGRGLVRYFLVRWAGEWPPDQQTSWEPEDHIPRPLVQRYFKMDRKRRAKLAGQPQNQPPEQTELAGKNVTYSSMNEIFDVDVQQNDIFGNTSQGGDEPSLFVEDDLDNEFLLVEDEAAAGQSSGRQQEHWRWG
jgi:hypothetical protein